jgi:hypothetical protein
MVHKYRLVKIYPGSPTRLGIIWSDSVLISLYGKLPDNNTHWEEVIKKDYEILSFIESGSNIVFERFDDYIYISGKSRITEEEALKSSLNIYSIKRLSDDEVFTVGNKVYNGYCITEILNFNTLNSELKILTVSGTTILSNIQHIKKPLFTTEDGVDINNLDSVYYIRNRWLEHKDYFIYNTTATKSSASTGHLYFSTKPRAYNYILMNKPCLSINDIKLSLDKSKKYQYHNTTLNNLINLLKTKL